MWIKQPPDNMKTNIHNNMIMKIHTCIRHACIIKSNTKQTTQRKQANNKKKTNGQEKSMGVDKASDHFKQLPSLLCHFGV